MVYPTIGGVVYEISDEMTIVFFCLVESQRQQLSMYLRASPRDLQKVFQKLPRRIYENLSIFLRNQIQKSRRRGLRFRMVSEVINRVLIASQVYWDWISDRNLGRLLVA